MLRVWGRRSSFNVQKVMWLVGELGLELEHRHIDAGGRYFEPEIERPPLPQVECRYRTLQRRPAFRQHVMIPFAELRGRLGY